jgi:PKD domain
VSQSRWLYRIIVVSLLAFPLFAQTISPEEARRHEASSYAAQVGVSADEAARRLELQPLAGELDAALAAEESAAFAGLFIDDKQQYRIVIRLTDKKAEERVRARVAGSALEPFIEFRPAKFSLADLEKKQKDTREKTKKAGVEQNSDINIIDNKVELYVTDPGKLKAKLSANKEQLAEGVEIQQVAELGKPEVAIHGGVPLSNCTSGWNVRSNSSGEVGTTTAAHCRDNGADQYYQGVLLPFRALLKGGHHDIQWMSTCDLFETANTFQSGQGLRYVTGTVHRNYQVVGQYVCKNGWTTGYKCGWIQTKNYDWGHGYHSTYIRVDSRSPYNDLSLPGDSGGPWFVEDKAYGTHVGAPAGDAYDSVYMAVNYISDLGVSVLTYNPGACTQPPRANFWWDRPYGDTYVMFDASSSYDPDGYIVSYYWDFGDGYFETTTTPYTEHGYWETGTYAVGLIVTDNEGQTGQRMMLVNVCVTGDDFCIQ